MRCWGRDDTRTYGISERGLRTDAEKLPANLNMRIASNHDSPLQLKMPTYQDLQDCWSEAMSSFSHHNSPAKSRARRPLLHGEAHKSSRSGWLRAAVLGSDDAIVSTASLMIGVAASSASNSAILVAGVAGLVAGAMSMAVGEFVSVSSQRDAEQADLKREKQELSCQPQAELRELAAIYENRGLEKGLAVKVAEQLSAHDRLGSHLRDELGIQPSSLSRPLQAAWISAVSFALFACVPIVALLIAPTALRIPAIAVLFFMSRSAGRDWRASGRRGARPSRMNTIGGAQMMTVTAAIGRIPGVSVV